MHHVLLLSTGASGTGGLFGPLNDGNGDDGDDDDGGDDENGDGGDDDDDGDADGVRRESQNNSETIRTRSGNVLGGSPNEHIWV